MQAHKVVMAACSDYFLTAICGSKSNGSESASDADNNMIVELQYVTMRGFAPLLEYAYTSELNVKASDIIDVLAAASYMQMIDVSERKLAKYFHVDELAANKIIMQNFKLLFNIYTNFHYSGPSIWSHKCDGLSYALLKASSFLLVTNCTEEN